MRSRILWCRTCRTGQSSEVGQGRRLTGPTLGARSIGYGSQRWGSGARIQVLTRAGDIRPTRRGASRSGLDGRALTDHVHELWLWLTRIPVRKRGASTSSQRKARQDITMRLCRCRKAASVIAAAIEPMILPTGLGNNLGVRIQTRAAATIGMGQLTATGETSISARQCAPGAAAGQRHMQASCPQPGPRCRPAGCPDRRRAGGHHDHTPAACERCRSPDDAPGPRSPNMPRGEDEARIDGRKALKPTQGYMTTGRKFSPTSTSGEAAMTRTVHVDGSVN